MSETEKIMPVDQRRFVLASSGVEAAVCEDIAKRQQLGIQKYGVTVADNPLELREWLQHAYEECLDQAVYLRRAIAELDLENVTAQATTPAPTNKDHGNKQ